jgi:hypothetical protein
MRDELTERGRSGRSARRCWTRCRQSWPIPGELDFVATGTYSKHAPLSVSELAKTQPLAIEIALAAW